MITKNLIFLTEKNISVAPMKPIIDPKIDIPGYPLINRNFKRLNPKSLKFKMT